MGTPPLPCDSSAPVSPLIRSSRGFGPSSAQVLHFLNPLCGHWDATLLSVFAGAAVLAVRPLFSVGPLP